MATLNLLYKHDIEVTDEIHIVIPTVGEIIDNEDLYYNLVSILTAMPIDLMVQLDDLGIDFSKINDYDLFLLMFPGLVAQDTRLLFGDFDLSDFVPQQCDDGKTVIFKNAKTGAVIDRGVHSQIAAVLRKIHHLEKNRRKPANEEAREYMLRRAREKAVRNKNRKQDSQLEDLIIAMVNTEQFKYNFDEVRNLTIYQFNESVRQVIKKVDYEHRMHGIYAGTVDVKSVSQDELNWLSRK